MALVCDLTMVSDRLSSVTLAMTHKITIVYFKIPGPWFFGRKIKITYSILKIHTFLKRL